MPGGLTLASVQAEEQKGTERQYDKPPTHSI